MRSKRGFALLFAVFIAGLMTTIGLAIFNITIKEVTLSGTGRESQFAFYAADTGAECALYWDSKGTNVFSNPSGRSGVFCNAIDVTTQSWVWSFDGVNATTTTFILGFQHQTDSNGVPLPYCAKVKVVKQDLSGTKKTTVESRGYNVGYETSPAIDCDAPAPSKVERGLRVNY